ncbi:hypothetical protein [Actinacidiphila glaucinigra]|uniref:hypothetical protein n=1 Tax=Actinacidiphila glaucinigra TaxID=235986 RepID=UPI0035E24F35
MMTWAQARELATELALAATGDEPAVRRAAERRLEQLDGRSWLLLNEAARSSVRVGGPRGSRAAAPTATTLLAAAVSSFAADGRIRQRAARTLAREGSRTATAALAVRLLDHVPQVREETRRALLPRLDTDHAEAVLDVLLAGRARRHAPAALGWVRDVLLTRLSTAELVSALVRSDRRAVRRWAYALGREHRLLTADELLAAVRRDPDQWLRAACAQWLMEVAAPAELRALLTAKSVEARLVALTRVPDEDLDDEDLLLLLADRSPRVRDQARWRGRRRGIDAADWYRGRLALPGTPAHVLAACLDGLAAVGGAGDLAAFTSRLRHPGVGVRAAAVTGVGAYADRDEALALLGPVLLDSSPRVSLTAASALLRIRAPQSAADAAWASDQPWSRRAAWRMVRGHGSWDRVEADLRAAGDGDPRLASLGLVGIHDWLATGAATTWAVLSDTQRRRIRDGLTAAPLDDTTRGTLAFHAGIGLRPPPAPVREDDAPTATATTAADRPGRPARRWAGLFRRR